MGHSPIHRSLSGTLAVLVASAVLPATAGTASAGTSVVANVDLTITAGPVAAAPGTTATHRVTVGNNGDAATVGTTLVTYVAPAYVLVDAAALPDGCEPRFQTPDPIVPDVVICSLAAGLEPGSTTVLGIPVKITQRARMTGVVRGRVSAVPAADSPDTDVSLADNWSLAYLTLTRPTPPRPDGNVVGLYLTHAMPALAKDGTTVMTFTVGNVGPNATSTTGKPPRLVAVIPFHVNVDPDQVPDNCTMLVQDPTIAVPDIISCDLPPLGVEEQRQVSIGVTAVPHGPKGLLLGPSIVASAEGDVDADQTDNLDVAAVLAPSRGN